MMMVINKKRHEAETEHLRDEISRLRGARMMDAETIRQQDERHRKAVKDLAAQSDEIEQRRKEKESLERDYKLRGELLTSARAEIAELRPDAEAMRAKRKSDRDQKGATRGSGKWAGPVHTSP